MILDQIMRYRRADLTAGKAALSRSELERCTLFAPPRRSLQEALRQRPRAVIAEVKKASPSRGVLREDFDPVAIARSYAGAGAAAISVLTEERHFQGSLQYLAAIRQAVEVPLLRKDFIFDPYQIGEARAFGADAVLLIVAVLSDAELRDLLAVASQLGLEALVEVHDAAELERALAAGARLLGVNNRDLRTFHTSLETTEALVARMPADACVVAESGIHSRQDIERLERCGVHAFLIGEALMRADDPGEKLAQLLGTSEAAR